MKFKTVQEAFNHYRNQSLEKIGQRAAQLKSIIDTDPNADITSINIEIEGLNQAKSNIQEKEQKARTFNPSTCESPAKKDEAPTETNFGSKEYRSAYFNHMLGQSLNEVEQRPFHKAMN